MRRACAPVDELKNPRRGRIKKSPPGGITGRAKGGGVCPRAHYAKIKSSAVQPFIVADHDGPHPGYQKTA